MSTQATPFAQVQAGVGAWAPPPGVTEHTGAPLSPDYDFFTSPPAEIGEIRSAYSSLQKGAKVNTVSARLRAVAIAAAVGIGIAIGLEVAVHLLTRLAFETHIPRPFWAVLPGALLAILFWRLTRSSGICNFVGSAGVAEFVGAAAGAGILRQKVLRFQDAEALADYVTRHFRRTEYTYTEFSFRWFPPLGEKPCFDIAGSHGANLQTPPTGNYYNYGRAAEIAWCAYLAPHLDAELAQTGYIRFFMGNKRWARLGRGFLEIEESDGAVFRGDAAEVGSVKMQSGYLTLTRKDGASGFFGKLGESGSFYFDLSTVRNSRLFLYAFERLLGIMLA